MSNTTDVELAFVDPNKVLFLFLTFSRNYHCGVNVFMGQIVNSKIMDRTSNNFLRLNRIFI